MSEILSSPPASAVRIIGLVGSLRTGSYTRAAVEIVLAGAREAGADAELVDLGKLKLPFRTGDPDDRQGHADVDRLRRAVQAAQGAVLGTPEYHGSFSGVLKNALDLTDLDDWRGRVIALVGVSGGSAGPGSALVGLRTVGRGLAAWVLPNQISIGSVHKAFDLSGQPLSPDLTKRLMELGRELVQFARLHAGGGER